MDRHGSLRSFCSFSICPRPFSFLFDVHFRVVDIVSPYAFRACINDCYLYFREVHARYRRFDTASNQLNSIFL